MGLKEINTKCVNKYVVYNRYVGFCKKRDFAIVPLEALPVNIFAGYYNGDVVYMLPIYKTDSDFCVLGFPVSDPDCPREVRDIAKLSIMKFAQKYMKELGFNRMITTSGTAPIVKLLEDTGFQLGDEDINQYVKIL